MFHALILLSALWWGTTSAVISWSGPGCLYRIPAGEQARLIACDARDVGHVLYLGQGATDGAMRPAAGDEYIYVRYGGTTEKARLHSLTYLAVWRG